MPRFAAVLLLSFGLMLFGPFLSGPFLWAPQPSEPGLAESHTVGARTIGSQGIGALPIYGPGPGAARAQTLPIPGLPGGLGGVGSSDAPEEEPAESPAETPGANGDAADTSGDAPGAGSNAAADGAANGAGPAATQALIDILRDEAAREALIRELEAGVAGTAQAPAAQTGAAPDPGAEAPASDPAAPAPNAQAEVSAPAPTFGERAVAGTRSIGGALVESVETVWLRMQRIPTTFTLSQRAFENGALFDSLAEVLAPALFIYATLLVLRLLLSPLRGAIARAADGAGWTKKLLLRIAATVIDLAAIPLSVTIGLIGVVVTGLAATGPNNEVALSDALALFINAYVSIEAARVSLRFILSPRSASLRMIALPEAAVSDLWRVGLVVLYIVGFGQLFFVPVISEGVSVFVGRAIAAMLSTVMVSVVILYVLIRRKPVANWLSDPLDDSAMVSMLRPFAQRWHWPVLVYLLYLLVTVLTRPGNVLLPLLLTTVEIVVVIAIGSMILTGLTERAGKRLTIPTGISERLPLLEDRVNQIRPGFLGVLRFFIFFVIILILLDVLGLQSIGGVISGAVLQQFSSGLFSVVLIVGLLSLVWLAMTSWVDYRLNPFIGTVPTPREITLLTLMKNAVTVALIIIGIITSLAQLGMNVGPLIASAGVIGLAISFGAQRMVEDIFSGIFIQAENAMNVGDVVDVGGTVGTVEKLTVRAVTLRDLSGVVHVIPFSSSAKVSNYMRDFSYHVADIGVAYREEVEDVRIAMSDAFERLRADPDHGSKLIGDMEWFGLNAFGPSELVMRARIKTLPGAQWGIGRAYNALVKQIFDERGIEIPFPHQTVYFGEDKAGRAPPLHMEVARAARPPAAPFPAEITGEATDGRHDVAAPRGQDHPDEDGR